MMSDLSKIDLQDDAATDAPEALDPAQNLLPDGTEDATTTDDGASGGKYY
jgi:hypothetical protein